MRVRQIAEFLSRYPPENASLTGWDSHTWGDRCITFKGPFHQPTAEVMVYGCELPGNILDEGGHLFAEVQFFVTVRTIGPTVKCLNEAKMALVALKRATALATQIEIRFCVHPVYLCVKTAEIAAQEAHHAIHHAIVERYYKNIRINGSRGISEEVISTFERDFGYKLSPKVTSPVWHKHREFLISREGFGATLRRIR